MNSDPLPYKDPPQLMGQTLNLAPDIDAITSISEIKSAEHAVAIYQEADRVKQNCDKVQRLAVTYLMKTMTQEQVAEKLDVSIDHVKHISGRAAFVGLRTSRQVHPGTPQKIADPEILNDLLSSKRDVEAYKRLPPEDREAIAAASNVKTKAQRLLEEARRRKHEFEEKYKATDEYKESRAKEIEEWKAKGREGLIKKGFQDISQSLTLILHELPKSDSKEETRASLKRLANQLAEAGIYPDKQPDE